MINRQYEFNVLNILNYNTENKLSVYYNWIKEHHKEVKGDILEAGVFQGKSILSTALLLTHLKSERVVYGFDSFDGFPPVYDTHDDLSNFENLHNQGKITATHLEQHHRLVQHRSFLKNTEIDEKNISSSETFENTSKHIIERKISYLGLKNIKLVEGDFAQTMSAQNDHPKNLSAALLDCDLYQSYMTALAFVWPRLSSGGIIFLDEYFSLKFPGARIAVDEFFEPFSNNVELKCHKSEDTFERWIAIKL